MSVKYNVSDKQQIAAFFYLFICRRKVIKLFPACCVERDRSKGNITKINLISSVDLHEL